MRVQNPARGGNRFKLGLFNANCDGGFTVSKAPERWAANWDDIVKLSMIADEVGIDFILPVAKWHGLGGEVDVLGQSYETLTHSAAIGAVTKRIGMFVTIHAPLLTPAFVAKALATIDHVTHGRVGLNIVCGWNSDEFALHGIEIDGRRRYEQGLEWFLILKKMLEGGAPFDWDGEFYQLRGVSTKPLCLQKPLPPIMSAGFSNDGRDFAARCADLLFTNVPTIEQAPAMTRSVRDYAAKYNRIVDVYASSHIVCRPTRTEAEDFYRYFADTMADHEALDYMRRQKEATASANTPNEGGGRASYSRRHGAVYAGTFPGSYMFVGSPDDIVEEMALLSKGGLSGVAITFLDYLADLPYFAQEVLPRLERLGLREKVAPIE